MEIQKSIVPIVCFLLGTSLAVFIDLPLERHVSSHARNSPEGERSRGRQWQGWKTESGVYSTPNTPKSRQQIPLRIPVSTWQFWNYMVPINIGTPPQNFTAILDIGWTDLLVPSVNCSTNDCRDNFHLYDSSKSSSYQPDLSPVSIDYNGLYTSGNVSIDTFRIGDLVIPNQVFEEATYFRPVPAWDFNYESVFGLALFPMNATASTLRAQGPFHRLMSLKKLDANRFSFKLPQASGSPGHLRLGGSNDNLYRGDLKVIPITENKVNSSLIHRDWVDFIVDVFASGWQVPVRSIALQSSPYALQDSATFINLSNCTAIFQTSFPYIMLPKEILEQIVTQYPVDPDEMTIACSDRASLPTLKIGLGLGIHEFSLSPFDYILELPIFEPGDAGLCSLPFAYLPLLQGSQSDFIILGSAFLHGLYSVFDVDDRSIGFAELRK